MPRGGRFNTRLNKDQKKGFDYHSTVFKSLIGDRDFGSYDTQGFYKQLYKDAGGNYDTISKMLTPNNEYEHIGVDKFKKPDHPTFSNESKYHIPLIRRGGNWEEKYFNATNRNIKNLANSEYGSAQEYFNNAEDLDGDGKPNIGLKHKGKVLIEPQYKLGGNMLVAHSTKGLWTKDDIKRVKSIYKKYYGGGPLEDPDKAKKLAMIEGSYQDGLDYANPANRRLTSYGVDGSPIYEYGKSYNDPLANVSINNSPNFSSRINSIGATIKAPTFDPNKARAASADAVTKANIIAQQQPGGMYSDKPSVASGANWKGAINSAVPYLSNIVNSFRKLPNPNAPLTEDYINPNLVNFDSQRNELRRLQTNANSSLNTQVAHGGVRNALKGQTLSSVISGSNNLAEKEAALNAGIKNQTAQSNSLIGARNIERQNNYRDELISKKMKEDMLKAENFADATNKFQLNRRDDRMFDLEERKLGILPKMYETGAFSRQAMEEYMKEQASVNKKTRNNTGNRFGGKVKSISSYIK